MSMPEVYNKEEDQQILLHVGKALQDLAETGKAVVTTENEMDMIVWDRINFKLGYYVVLGPKEPTSNTRTLYFK